MQWTREAGQGSPGGHAEPERGPPDGQSHLDQLWGKCYWYLLPFCRIFSLYRASTQVKRFLIGKQSTFQDSWNLLQNLLILCCKTSVGKAVGPRLTLSFWMGVGNSLSGPFFLHLGLKGWLSSFRCVRKLMNVPTTTLLPQWQWKALRPTFTQPLQGQWPGLGIPDSGSGPACPRLCPWVQLQDKEPISGCKMSWLPL